MLEINNLNVVFGTGSQAVKVVNNVSFCISEGECYGLVGESGSGKSTVLNCICGLNKAWSGKISVNSENVDYKRNRQFYLKLQIVFQDPYGSLHPRHTIDQTLKEPLLVHGKRDINSRIKNIMDEVGLETGCRFRYPHQLSGGQRQRVAIARALILEPAVLLLDEPTSALDVSIQAEVLNLLKKIQKERNLTSLLVSHDLAVISHMCRKIAVMANGSIVEVLNKKQLQTGNVKHPYTKQLLEYSRGYDRLIVNEIFVPKKW